MVRYINRLLLVIAILALSFYVLYHNPQGVTVYLSKSWQYSGELGLFLIVSFLLGIIAASLVAFYFASRAFLRERRLLRREKDRLDFYQAMAKARALMASELWEPALRQWQTVIRKDPTAIVARIESAQCLERMGDLQKALERLNEARSLHPDSEEVLLRAAELNLKLSNRTAALDNFELLLRSHLSPGILRRARELAREVGAYGKAAEFQEKLDQMGESDRNSSQRMRAELAFDQLMSSCGEGASEECLKQLRTLCHEQPFSARALNSLAKHEENAGNLDGAAEALIRRARLLATEEGWMDLVGFWSTRKQPERALAALRAATKELEDGLARNFVTLELAKFQVRTGMVTDAERTLSDLSEQLSTLSEDQKSALHMLEARVALALRDYQRAEQALVV